MELSCKVVQCFLAETPTIRIGPNIQAESGAMRAQTAGGMRRRPRTARQRMMTRREEYDDYDESAEEIFVEGSADEMEPMAPEVPWKDDEPSGKVGTKKLRKLQEKAEKKEQREVCDNQKLYGERQTASGKKFWILF